MFANNLNRRVSAPSAMESSPIVASQMRSSNERPSKRRRTDEVDPEDDFDQTQVRIRLSLQYVIVC
jgi:hypothetical protein